MTKVELKDVTLEKVTPPRESVWRPLFQFPKSLFDLIGISVGHAPCGCQWFENAQVLDHCTFPTRQACEEWAREQASKPAVFGVRIVFLEAQHVVKGEG